MPTACAWKNPRAQDLPNACIGPAPLAKRWPKPDLSGNINEEYIYFNGARIARVDRPSGAVHYYFSDHLGSASVIADSLGNVELEQDFFPYGAIAYTSGSDPNHYKFTGKERDTESNLDTFGARYYTSNIGRFMTPDWSAAPEAVPYANFFNPQTLNLYAMVANNPESFADLDGHDPPLAAPGAGLTPDGKPEDCANDQQKCEAQNKPAESVTAPFPIIPAAPAIGKALGAIADVVGDALGSALGVVLVVFTPTQTMRDEDYLKPIQQSGPKAADAPGVTAGGQATDAHGNKLGPSGETQIDRTRSNTREGARNRALGEGSGAVEHSNPRVGSRHWHPTDSAGNKKPSSTHHEYPDE